jgi:uncharacterized protein (UPF0147 family)
MSSKPKVKKREINEENIKKAIEIMSMVLNDLAAPKNIRKTVKDAIDILNKTDMTPGVRASASIQMLDEAIQDANIPTLSRTRLWSALSILESVKD